MVAHFHCGQRIFYASTWQLRCVFVILVDSIIVIEQLNKSKVVQSVPMYVRFELYEFFSMNLLLILHVSPIFHPF
jgi:hypothetical protein